MGHGCVATKLVQGLRTFYPALRTANKKCRYRRPWSTHPLLISRIVWQDNSFSTHHTTVCFLVMFPLRPRQVPEPIRPVNPVMLFENISQWISQRVRSLIPTPPVLGAFAVPTEITLIISSHLNITSRLCLALTCRTLFLVCFPKRLLLESTEKEELLLLLEKDVSSHYFCHCCAELHRWHGRWTRSINQWNLNCLPCEQGVPKTLLLPIIGRLQYYYARLLMNRHLYGPRHGPPLRSLEYGNRSLRWPGGIVEVTSRCARIVDNQLLLLQTISLSHTKGDTALIRQHFNSLQRRVCAHMTTAPGNPDYGPIGVPELAEPKRASSRFSPCSHGLGSCSICLTDYSVDITWRGDRRGYSITVRIYSQVGECRSASAWEWRTMASSWVPRDELLRIDQSAGYELGCLRDRWNRAEGIVMEEKGAWAAISRRQAELRMRSRNLAVSDALWSRLY